MMEHNSVLRPLYEMEGQERSFCWRAAMRKGRLLYEDLEEKIRRGAKLAVVTHASNVTGNRNDLRRIRENLPGNRDASYRGCFPDGRNFPDFHEGGQYRRGLLYGPQSLMGPQGTGGLCVRKGVEILVVAFRRKRNSYL